MLIPIVTLATFPDATTTFPLLVTLLTIKPLGSTTPEAVSI